jgi:nucleoid-associated protein YgaU
MTMISTTSTGRIVVPVAALVAAVAVAGALAIWQMHEAPPVETKIASAPPTTAKPPPAQAEAPSAVAAAQRQAKDLANVLGGTSSPAASANAGASNVPSFDVVRIEPNGDAVVAGRAAPGATVELLRNGEFHDRVVADQSGEFAMVPRPLPPGSYDLTLRVKRPDGTEVTSKQSVTVALEPNSNNRPMVALMTPDMPTVVLSQPAASAKTNKVAVEAVDVEPSGKLHVSGRARPGAAVRLYLNDSFVAAVTADANGHLAVTVNQGVAPGNYRVRLDEVAASSGTVSARAEVPFNVPDTMHTASIPAQTAASERPASEPAQVATAGPQAGSPSAVVVPKIATVTVSRGDSLWRISHRALGSGTRYAIIYKANQKQIRNPNLIYPGQVFVMPAAEAR